MKLDPQLIIDALKPHGFYFIHVDKGPIQEWRGLLTTCEPDCTWFNGFSIIEGVDNKFCIMQSSVLQPDKMVAWAYMKPEELPHIVRMLTRQMQSDHRKGCRLYKAPKPDKTAK